MSADKFMDGIAAIEGLRQPEPEPLRIICTLPDGTVLVLDGDEEFRELHDQLMTAGLITG